MLTNQAGGTINGFVQVLDAAGTVFNAGIITTGTTGLGGVYLNSGVVSNAATGVVIAGIGAGITIGANGASVSNAGSISGATGVGVAGGRIDNLAGARISAVNTAVYIGGGGGTVTNAGSVSSNNIELLLRGLATLVNTGDITASGAGVSLSGGGFVSNAAGRTISSGGIAIGETAGARATVFNDGTLLGSTGIYLGGGGLVTIGASAVLGATTGFGASAYGVDIRSAAGTVTNAGTIGARYFAVALRNGGTATNAATGRLYAHGYGIMVNGTAGTAINLGAITSANGGMLLGAGGFGSNAASGTILATSGYGMDLGSASGTLINAGQITQTRNGFAFTGGIGINTGGTFSNLTGASVRGFQGVILIRGGMVNNAVGAQITGNNYGVISYNLLNSGQPSTIANSGVIAGTVGGGIQLYAGGSITNFAGATIRGPFSGIKINHHDGQSTVSTAPAVIVNDGTISGATGILVADTTVVASITLSTGGSLVGTGGTAALFGAGDDLLLARPGASFSGKVDGGAGSNLFELASGSGSISGFGSSIVNFGSIAFDAGARWTLAGSPAGFAGPITGFAAGDTIDLTGLPGETISQYASGTLTLGGPQAVSLVLPGAFTTASFRAVTDNAGGTSIALACFAAGTRIATATGERAVEDLQAGDVVCLAGGGTAPVIWIGHRRLDLARHNRPQDVTPVRVRAGAFGAGQPSRDLLLSPDHAIFTEGALVPVRYLLNGRSVQQEQVDVVTYFHVELPAHGIILAENLPCESYLDTGNRAAFANAGQATLLHPDFARAVWAAKGAAELVVEGPRLEAARRHLLAQAFADGDALTDAPGLGLWAGDRELRLSGGAIRIGLLPRATQRARLVSRVWVPAQLPGGSDPRRLGVALADLRLDGRAVPLDDPRFGSGWHPPEADWRWTDGNGVLDVRGARALSFRVVLNGTYWLDPAETEPAATRSTVAS